VAVTATPWHHHRRFTRALLVGVLATVASAAGAAAGSAAGVDPYAAPPGLLPLMGALHEHSGYSDGKATTRPADSFASGARAGLDFMGSSEHAETLNYPMSFGSGCLDTQLPSCIFADQQRAPDSLRKWQAIAEQAQAATTPSFAAFRGFEWSSPQHGHMNVFFSANFTDSYVDGTAARMQTFWDWFARAPRDNGGADGLATFNHPGYGSDSRWEDFRYVPQVAERVVGLETLGFRGDDYGSGGGPAGGAYARALDRGWHVGAIGAEDEHTPARAARVDLPKTILFARERSSAGVREALLARRFYAVLGPWRRLSLTVDDAPMGSRLERKPGEALRIAGQTNDPGATVELVTGQGAVVATGLGSVQLTRPAGAGEPYYFLRVRSVVRDGQPARPVAYSTPVWVNVAGEAAGAAARERLRVRLRRVARPAGSRRVVLVARGQVATAGVVRVRLLRDGRTVTVRRVQAGARGEYQATFRVRTRGGYRVAVGVAGLTGRSGPVRVIRAPSTRGQRTSRR